LTVVLLVGLCLPSLALADDSADANSSDRKKTSTGVWFPWWTGSKDKVAENKPAAKLAKKDTPPAKGEVPAVAGSEPARDALLRRLAVCDQLRLIATQTKDDALLRQADELDERVWRVYAVRGAQSPAKEETHK
jgi:hypothetical protein